MSDKVFYGSYKYEVLIRGFKTDPLMENVQIPYKCKNCKKENAYITTGRVVKTKPLKDLYEAKCIYCNTKAFFKKRKTKNESKEDKELDKELLEKLPDEEICEEWFYISGYTLFKKQFDQDLPRIEKLF